MKEHHGLSAVRDRLARAARDSDRPPSGIELIVVSKTFEAGQIAPVIAAGQNSFGENRVQEAMRKWPALKDAAAGIRLHLIGPLQSNKAADAVALFDAIHTVDRVKLAHILRGEMTKQGRTLDIFVQVNTGREPQKAGVEPEDTGALVGQCLDMGLPVKGLMCIPPAAEDPEPHFRLLAALADQHGLPALSMGMSGDFETAIACGATHVRVGSAVFGHRG